MRFGIIANLKRPQTREVIDRVIDWVGKNGHDYKICQELKDSSTKSENICSKEELSKYCDFVISMGGDGTLLAVARTIADSKIPILGINLGSLGFLTQVTTDELERALDLINKGKHTIEKRLVLESYVVGMDQYPNSFALNDVVVDRGDVARLIELNLYVNDEFISTYFADGLIISTPTGSTAYNAAVGGPILNPLMQAIVASPMAPQSLSARPLLFKGDDQISIKIVSHHGSGLLTSDGQVSIPLVSGDEIRISQAKHSTYLVTFQHNSFYQILRNKLNWAALPKWQNK